MTHIRHKSSHARRVSGFTLIELVITIAVAAILAGLAAPSFRAFTANQRLRSASSDLVLQLMFTRSEALKQNGNITMASATSNTSWQGGWNISDAGGVLKKQNALTGVSITSSVANVVYNRSGRVNNTGDITFEVSDTTGASVTPRCVTVKLTGQPVSKSGGC